MMDAPDDLDGNELSARDQRALVESMAQDALNNESCYSSSTVANVGDTVYVSITNVNGENFVSLMDSGAASSLLLSMAKCVAFINDTMTREEIEALPCDEGSAVVWVPAESREDDRGWDVT